MNTKPVIGVLLGDAAGVGPELVAKTAASGFLSEHCRPLIIGDTRVFAHALKLMGLEAAHYSVDSVDQADWEKGIPVLDQKDQDPAVIKTAEVNAESGKAIVNMIEVAADLCKKGQIEGFVFGPFNKGSMKLGGCKFESEHHLFADLFGVTGPFGEINMLGNLMTTRTTSHIPIKDVSGHLTVETIMRAIKLSYDTVLSSGIEKPRIGVAALNPHCGEGGRCGREEIDVIGPAVEKAQSMGMDVKGPYPSDILFIKAFNGEFDSAVTMYHDQGQIALKLKGFDQGITVAGGMPYPIATCAHGTAYDIAGKGIASTSAFENAVIITSRMAAHRQK